MLLPHEAHAVVKKNRRGIAAPFPRHSAPKRRRPYRGTSFHRRYMRSLTCVLPCALFRRRGLSNAPRCVFYAAVYPMRLGALIMRRAAVFPLPRPSRAAIYYYYTINLRSVNPRFWGPVLPAEEHSPSAARPCPLPAPAAHMPGLRAPRPCRAHARPCPAGARLLVLERAISETNTAYINL